MVSDLSIEKARFVLAIRSLYQYLQQNRRITYSFVNSIVFCTCKSVILIIDVAEVNQSHKHVK